MKTRWQLVLAGWVAAGGIAAGQTAPTPKTLPVRASMDVPPLTMPSPADAAGLPNGKPVSRVLQSVIVPETPSTRQPTPPPPSPAPSQYPLPPGSLELGAVFDGPLEVGPGSAVRPLGTTWASLEYLLWWPKGQPLPPVVTAARGETVPELTSPTTAVLVGGVRAEVPDISGGRFTFGQTLNETETLGAEITYFFLGSRTTTVAISETEAPNTRLRFVGRPVINPVTGAEGVIPVALPGAIAGSISVATTTRATGWEVTGVGKVYSCPTMRVNALTGYRYFSLNEGLRIDQYAFRPAGADGSSQVLSTVVDEFSTANRFQGGQFGLHADLSRGPFFAGFTGKFAVGGVVQIVRVSGQTGSVSSVAATYDPSGVLAQLSNSGRTARSLFAVLPEAELKVGCRFMDNYRVYLGYNFLYLSDAVRPGDQIDRVVDPATVPLTPRVLPAIVGDNPGSPFLRSDFWVHGLIVGFECRY